MTHEQKKQVRDALVRYTANFPSQAEAAQSLEGISTSTISQVRNNNWGLLSDRLWQHIARQVGFYCGDWQSADTSAFLLLRILFSDAQHYNMSYGIAMGEGTGKTFTAAHYARSNKNVCYISCSEDHNRRDFLITLLTTAGVQPKGNVPELIQQFAAYIKQKEQPLILLDDVHKLKDRVMHLLVMIAGAITGHAGIAIMGSSELRTKIIDGMRNNKAGYNELYKNIGRRFITLSSLAPRDVELVCRANGVYDDDVIAHITNGSGNNLHTATRLILEQGMMQLAA